MSRPDSFEDNTATWKQVAFPFSPIPRVGGYRYNRYLNMNMIKSMLIQMDLKAHKDFLFNNRKTFDLKDYIVVKFENEGNTTIAMIKWLGSDWYNGRF
jgi:hypothetical protein